MFISLNLLEDFIPLRKKYKAHDLALDLTMHTVEIEGYQDLADKYQQVVVGEALEVKKHPQADRLKIAIVDVGTEKLSIVCGAPNLETGQKVAVALIGATLPIGLTITEAEIRGEHSQGMICAEDELGLGDNHDGIMVLDKKAKIGQSLAKHLGLDDVIMEIDNKSLSNRPDLWGHYGIAREIAAFSGIKLKDYDKVFKSKIEIKEDKDNLNIKIEDDKVCPYYSAVKVKNIKVSESPLWLKNRLLAAGLKPINNLVDISNYVMIELGQPLHIFDANGIDKILVRKAKEGEKIELLDKTEKELSSNNLLITDGKMPLAIAGVMGGLNSAVKDGTKEIIIESANFEAVNIRKSSLGLGLRTDASSRYEKSLDINLCPLALKRVLDLMIQIIPDIEIDSQITASDDIKDEIKLIDLNLAWLYKRIGKEIDREKVIKILISLGFEIENDDGENLQIKVPSYRATKDVSIAEDLLEEVSRMIGYDNLEPALPSSTLEVPIIGYDHKIVEKIKDILAKDVNLSEVHNYSFVGTKQLNKLGISYDNYLTLANPLTEHHTLLRQNLIVNILENVKTNQARFKNIEIFELGEVYLNVSGKLQQSHLRQSYLPHQEKRIAICLASDKEQIQRIKDVLQTFVNKLLNNNKEISFQAFEFVPAWANKQKSALVKYKSEDIGYIYTLNKKTAKEIGIKKHTVVSELNFKVIKDLIKKQADKKYINLPKFPALERDLAFLVDKKVPYEDLKNDIFSFHKWIENVELFDVYQGENIDDTSKSLAFHVKYRLQERTLEAKEVDKMQVDLIQYLQDKYKAKIRGSK
ncbi:MAG TPA: phenylalanine--tRNA ligase subunit beta [Patescibacteria group bacterium]|nr:phenylalanine--tRNA ligase subunit beta [Patescibacteria group bacterium]